MKKLLVVATFGLVLVALVVSGCGKKGATSLVASQVSDNGAAAAAGGRSWRSDPNIAEPLSSVEVDGEMHTNFLIYLGHNGAQLEPLATTPSGFSPAQIAKAYGLTPGGSGTIVIVDAYDDKYALADFNAFSSQYGLPQETSTTVTASTNKVLQVVYASGSKPSFNSGWSQEADLDIEWAHAMAPNAKIVLVEAASNSNANLYAAEDKAATIAGVQQVSNSWGGSESSTESSNDTHFQHAGVTYLFSSGDTGGAKEYPAASPYVVAVGGTSLTLASGGARSTETVWNGTGCGPSGYEARPAYQNAVSTIVGTKRGIADVAAVADPNTGVAVRWNGGWYVFGGTSVACPVISGIINTSGTNRGSGTAENTQIYAGLGGANFYDVTSGKAGSYSGASGYDFPTGVGAPKGTAGF